MSYYQHESAIIDEGAEIGEGSRVWHFVHVCGGAKIGKGVSLGQNVFVGNKVKIGDNITPGSEVMIIEATEPTLIEGTNDIPINKPESNINTLNKKDNLDKSINTQNHLTW